jgi:PAS domain S-box-containing protein
MEARSKVLIVEDEFVTGTDIQNSLTEMGYEAPCIVDNGAEAIRRAGELRPDVVLMDIILKGEMSGIQAAAEIRERYDIPVLFLTAHSDEATVEMAKIAGPFGYIIKPFESQKVRVGIEMALYRHAMEERLRGSEETIRALLDVTRDEIVLVDHEGKILALNDAFASRAGKPARELVGRPVSGLIPPGTITVKTADELHRIFAEGRVSFEEEDQGRCFDTTLYTVADRKKTSLRIAIFRHDITNLKLMEDQLKLTNRQLLEERERLLFLTTALDSMSDSVVITDWAGKITYVNTTFEKKFGLSNRELYGKPIGDLAHPENTVNLSYDFFQAFWGADWTGFFLAKNSSGARMPMTVRGKPILYENNRPRNFVFVMRDRN